jgi:hypothetical protein
MQDVNVDTTGTLSSERIARLGLYTAANISSNKSVLPRGTVSSDKTVFPTEGVT